MTATRRPSSRARPATIASSSPNSRSPWSSTKPSVMAATNSSVRGRRGCGPAGPAPRPSSADGPPPAWAVAVRRSRRSDRSTGRRRRMAGLAAAPARRPARRASTGTRAAGSRARLARRTRPAARRAVRGPAGGAGARPARRAARTRGTTRSMKPCPNRNSARWKPGGSSWAMVPADTRAPAKPISASGSAMFTSPTAANDANTPPVVGSDRTDRNGTPAGAQALERGEGLGQLHQGERALLHPRAARRADDDERDPLGRGRARRRG